LNKPKKIWYLLPCAFLFLLFFGSSGFAQERPRLVKGPDSRPINQPPAPVETSRIKPLSSSLPLNQPAPRPTLTNKLVVAQPEKTLIQKTASSAALNAPSASAGKAAYGSAVSTGLMRGIQTRLGIPYRYGSTGPNRYDCSGFVWAAFNDAGVNFTRQSARSLWAMGTPVEGEDRYKFGTLVFLNGLKHVGIVADENGFYHASSSKGITYSPFKGYWEKRIVGFRRVSGEVALKAAAEKGPDAK
jgi:cell wall-associated NlpC family hydrolase